MSDADAIRRHWNPLTVRIAHPSLNELVPYFAVVEVQAEGEITVDIHPSIIQAVADFYPRHMTGLRTRRPGCALYVADGLNRMLLGWTWPPGRTGPARCGHDLALPELRHHQRNQADAEAFAALLDEHPELTHADT